MQSSNSITGFLLWPILWLYKVYLYFPKNSSKYVIMLFFGLYGYSVIYDSSQDLNRYEIYFIEGAEKSLFDFFESLKNLFTDNAKPDILFDILLLITSKVTSNHRVFFFIQGLFLGYGFYKLISIINFQGLSKKKFIYTLLFLTLLFLFLPFRIFSFRHYLACCYFLFIFSYIANAKNLKETFFYFFLITFSVFIHFGFISLIPFVILYAVNKNRNIVYYALIIFAFTISNSTSLVTQQFAEDSEIAIAKTASAYSTESYNQSLTEIRTQGNFLVHNFVFVSTLILFLLLILQNHFYPSRNSFINNWFSFLMSLSIFLVLIKDVSSISGRFQTLFILCSIIYFLLLFNDGHFKFFNNYLIRFAFVSIFVMIFIVNTRLYIESASIVTMFPLGLFFMFLEIDVSLFNLLGR